MKIKNLIILLIITGSSLLLSQGKNQFIGVGYGTFSWGDSDLAQYTESPAPLVFEYSNMTSEYFGARISVWTMSSNWDYNLGDMSQLGASIDLLAKYPIHLESLIPAIYGGAGLVYQTTKVETNASTFGSFEAAEHKGYGITYFFGAELIIAGTVGIYSEFRGISSKVEDLDFSSSGVVIGAKVGWK